MILHFLGAFGSRPDKACVIAPYAKTSGMISHTAVAQSGPWEWRATKKLRVVLLGPSEPWVWSCIAGGLDSLLCRHLIICPFFYYPDAFSESCLSGPGS